MAEIVKITKDQPFVLYVPLVILNGDGSKEVVDAASLSNVLVKLQSACGETESTFSTFDHFLVLDLPATLTTGVHAVIITANLPQGRQFALRIKRAFEVVDWDHESNWRDYLVGDHIELSDQPFIAGEFTTDAEYEELKRQLLEQIAAAEQAEAEAIAEKERYAEALEHLDDVAKQGDNPNATNTAILAAFGNIDFSTLAKQGDNPNATNTAILAAVNANDAAEQVKDFFGIVKDGDTVKVVTEDGGEEVVEPVGLMDEDDVYDYLEDIAVLMGGITAQQAASITAATRAIIHGGSGSGSGE